MVGRDELAPLSISAEQCICSQTQSSAFPRIPIQCHHTWMENISRILPRSRKCHGWDFSSSTGTKEKAKNTALGNTVITVNIQMLK